MEAKEKNYIQNKGITLVALVITIVILLILAGISISTLTNTGIFQKSKDAKQKAENAQKEEESFLSEYEKEILKQDSNGIWDGNVNKPDLMSGMMAIKFTEPTDTTEGKDEKVSDSSKNDWYNYSEKKWANAKTNDGSMWVWIPRYAYKVVYNDPSDKSKGGKFDIVFLIGTTDNYIDDNGNIQTAQRQTEKNQVIETDSTKTDKYTVHPAFTNESSIDYANGGWNKELTGIWVAKFEAGYASGNNRAEVKSSNVNYSQSDSVVWSGEAGTSIDSIQDARNWIDGIYGQTITPIKYPTFQGLTYAMNYINQEDAFSISRALTDNKNIYGFNNNSTDSHLIKNSEWGAIVYLSQSKFGLDGENIIINNVTVSNSTQSVYIITGCAGNDANANAIETTIEKLNNRNQEDVYIWKEKKGTKASTTGTIYGIYDMSGGLWERSSALVNNNQECLKKYGNSIMASLNNGKSSEYVTVYPTGEISGQNLNDAGRANYAVDTQIYGDAIRETSEALTRSDTWFYDYSLFVGSGSPFFIRGGYYKNTTAAGLFFFARHHGFNDYNYGFRTVLVAK